jgi:hypothetical protein
MSHEARLVAAQLDEEAAPRAQHSLAEVAAAVEVAVARHVSVRQQFAVPSPLACKTSADGPQPRAQRQQRAMRLQSAGPAVAIGERARRCSIGFE